MRQTITISLPKELKKELDALRAEEGISRSDVIRECLQSYLLIHRFRSFRRQMVEKAKARGIYTDEDVFKLIS